MTGDEHPGVIGSNRPDAVWWEPLTSALTIQWGREWAEPPEDVICYLPADPRELARLRRVSDNASLLLAVLRAEPKLSDYATNVMDCLARSISGKPAP